MIKRISFTMMRFGGWSRYILFKRRLQHPTFIYATFEQADNILTADSKPVEDADGNVILKPEPELATTPQVILVDPKPPSDAGVVLQASLSGSVF